MTGDLIGTVAARAASRLHPAILGRQATNDRILTLTIDDGPSAETVAIAAMLQEVGVAATWFLVGMAAQRYPAAVAALGASGHAVGNHGFAHIDYWSVKRDSASADLSRGLDVVQDLTGARCQWTRPPFGHLRPSTLRWCKEHEQVLTLWDVLAPDYTSQIDPKAVSARVGSRVRPGSILVMHDQGRTRQIETIELTVKSLLAQGWTFHPLQFRGSQRAGPA